MEKGVDMRDVMLTVRVCGRVCGWRYVARMMLARALRLRNRRRRG